MRALTLAAGLLSLVSTAFANDSTPSKEAASVTFRPPQVFKNANLVHIISLEKNYAKEQINVVIENIDKEPQDEYYLPFTADQMSRVGGLEVKDRKDDEAGPFVVEAVDIDPERYALAHHRYGLSCAATHVSLTFFFSLKKARFSTTGSVCPLH